MIRSLQVLGRWVRYGWAVLGSTLLLLIVVEWMATAVVKIRNAAHSEDNPALHRDRADVNAHESWYPQFLKDSGAIEHVRWTPYVYWKHVAYHSPTINIDEDGLRATWKAPLADSAAAARPLIVWTFGGSTMWGDGARDDFTIASWLARRLHEQGIPARVTNFGETGYVNTQGVLTLLMELRKGQVPDLVVFYDGANDMGSAYRQRVAGIPSNEFNRVREFRLTNARLFPRLLQVTGQEWAQRLSIIQLISGTTLNAHPDGIKPWQAPAPIDDADPLIGSVFGVYTKNTEIVRSLAATYGFKALFYWQPTIFDKQRPTAYEARIVDAYGYFGPFVAQVRRWMGRQVESGAVPPGFNDISGIFHDELEPMFIDWCHVGERANQRIADRMMLDLRTVIDAR